MGIRGRRGQHRYFHVRRHGLGVHAAGAAVGVHVAVARLPRDEPGAGGGGHRLRRRNADHAAQSDAAPAVADARRSLGDLFHRFDGGAGGAASDRHARRHLSLLDGNLSCDRAHSNEPQPRERLRPPVPADRGPWRLCQPRRRSRLAPLFDDHRSRLPCAPAGSELVAEWPGCDLRRNAAHGGGRPAPADPVLERVHAVPAAAVNGGSGAGDAR